MKPNIQDWPHAAVDRLARDLGITVRPKFKIGDKVYAVPFTDCFGKPVQRTDGLTVIESRRIETINHPLDSNPLKPYYRIVARPASGLGYIEGAERFFEFQEALDDGTRVNS